MFLRLFERFPDLRFGDAPPARRATAVSRGLERLPVVLTRRRLTAGSIRGEAVRVGGARGNQAVVELLLVRHALPVRRELEIGVADPELSENGHAQAGHLAEYLAAEAPLDALYTSPLNRARQTAAPIAARFGLEIVVSEAVAEWDRHSNEYVPIEELKAADDPRWQALLRGEWTSHDESPEQFTARVVGAIEALIARHRGQRIAVVCHGGVINSYLAHVLGLDGQHSFFYPNYTSIHRVAAAATGERSIVTINETAHLRGTGLPVGLFQR